MAHDRAEAQPITIGLFVNEGSVALPGGRLLYHWGFGASPDDPGMPARVLRAVEGDQVTLSVTNNLDAPHAFAIEGVVDTGSIAPGDLRRRRSSSTPRGRAPTCMAIRCGRRQPGPGSAWSDGREVRRA